MKIKVYALLMALFLPTLTYADYFSGNDIMGSWNNKYHESNIMIRGYITGVQDAYNGVYFCVDSEVKMSQAAEIVIKYLKDNPAKWHEAGKNLVIEALSKEFSCGNESNKVQ